MTGWKIICPDGVSGIVSTMAVADSLGWDKEAWSDTAVLAGVRAARQEADLMRRQRDEARAELTAMRIELTQKQEVNDRLDEELQQADDAMERAGLERGKVTPADAIQALHAELTSVRETTMTTPTPHDDDGEKTEIDNRRIANYIVQFLRSRNGGELDEAIAQLTVESYELLHDELEQIIRHRGRPPNWTAP